MPDALETPRLRLRPWHPGDLALLHEALCESVEHLRPWIPWATPATPTVEETRERLETWTLDFESGANHIYAVFHRGDGGLVGGVGLYPRIGPGALEIGYWIRLGRARSGLATEATQALTDVAFGLAGIERVEIRTDPKNLGSRRVPEKLGYRLAAIHEGREGPDGDLRDTVIYELCRKEYLSAS